MKAKAIFDFCGALFGIMVILPLSIIIATLILLDSPGGVFYRQRRIGYHLKPFLLIKFRTMHSHSDDHGLLTIGNSDQRITKMGCWLRKYKLDELPQLINILIGDMSFVGPRPEVPKYVEFYSENQLRVLSVKPGLTDEASLSYFNENEILAKTTNPEKIYINEIIPAKIQQSLSYIDHQSFWGDISIIFKTLTKVLHQTQ